MTMLGNNVAPNCSTNQASHNRALVSAASSRATLYTTQGYELRPEHAGCTGVNELKRNISKHSEAI